MFERLIKFSMTNSLFLLALLLLFRGQAEAQPDPDANKSVWLEVEIGPIGVASVDILASAIKSVEEEKYAGLLLTLDTPGGSLEATQAMVKTLLGARFPIVVWVGPSGARAASAGAFITLAAPIAAMAPGSRIGAAHPVQILGQDLEPGSDTRTKIENDTEAFMEAIADIRKRNKEMAVSFVSNSLSVSAEEALQSGVIDLIAPDRASLMEKLQGRKVSLAGGKEETLATTGASFEVYEKSLRQTLLETLSNPDLFYLLFILGLIGIGFELTHPGSIAPGVVGAMALILALIATSVLPINFGALLLVLASIAFMIAELFLPSFGILGIGGFIGFVVGSLLLVDPSRELGFAISWWTVIPGSLVVLAAMALGSWLIVRHQRSRVRSGSEGLIGQQAEALTDFGPDAAAVSQGQVRLQGEIWKAEEVEGRLVKKGDLLQIKAIEGLTLKVFLTRSPTERTRS